MSDRPERLYRFGDSSQPGILLGLSVGQAVPVVAGVLWLSLCLQIPRAGPVGLVGAACGFYVAFGRWHGAPITEILVPAGRLWARRRLRRHRWHKPVTAPRGLPEPLPVALAGIDIIDWSAADAAEPVAIAHDTRTGTSTAVVRVSGNGFPLASADVQSTRLDAWGAALSPFARQGCPVTRIALHHWSRPVVPSMACRHDPEDVAVADYLDLVDRQATSSMTHEVLIAITVDQRRVRARGRRSRMATAIDGLLDEVHRFRARLETAGLTSHGTLTCIQLATAIRERSDPTRTAQLATLRSSLAQAAGRGVPAPIEWGPLVVEPHWHQVAVDGSRHRTYRIANWPPLPVPPDWLGSLVSEPAVTRTITVVMEPIATSESARRADREAMAREADADSKSRRGFRISAHDRKRLAEVEGRERELAQGHAEFRFVGLVDVVASDEEALAEAAATIEQAAARSLIDVRPLEARHDQAWVASLPLGRNITARAGLLSA